MRGSALAIIVAGLCLTIAIAGIAVAQDEIQYVRGEPDISVYAPEPTLTPGTTTELTLQIENEGEIRGGATARREIVTTARAVNIELRERRSPITVETRRQSIGAVADGEVREVPVTVTVPEDATPGEYTLDARIRYAHTFQFAPQSGVVQERSRTVTRPVEISIDDGPRFEIETLDSDVQIGDTGVVRTSVRNIGGEAARDLTVGLESSSADVAFGGHTRNTGRIDRLDPGENATIAYDVTIRPDASLRNITLTGDVRFTNIDGVQTVQEGLSTGLGPVGEQDVSLSVSDTTLRVGETGAVRGTIQNNGPSDMANVVLAVGDAQFEPRSPTYAIGDLASGESATFQFRGVIPTEADAVPQRIDIETRYRTPADNEQLTAGSIHVPVSERRDAVSISAINPQFSAGEEGVLELEITNRRDIEIRDIRLHLEVDDPLESDFRSTVVGSLHPGETDRVAFDLEVDSDAPVSQYPAVVETTYTDDNDELVTPRPATVAVTVTESEGVDDLPIELVIFGLLSILVGVVFVWLYKR